MGVDAKSFGTDHTDEQQGKPVFARGRPKDIEPPTRGQETPEQILAALADAKLHDTDSYKTSMEYIIPFVPSKGKLNKTSE